MLHYLSIGFKHVPCSGCNFLSTMKCIVKTNKRAGETCLLVTSRGWVAMGNEVIVTFHLDILERQPSNPKWLVCEKLSSLNFSLKCCTI